MRVAVIGGGIAGLSAAHELIRHGAQPIVFEAEARPGGKVGTHAEQGYLTEDGPNFIARLVRVSPPRRTARTSEPKLRARRPCPFV